MKDVADALARLNELGRPDLVEPIHFLMGERDGLMKALASAKTVIESKDKAYSLIQQRWDSMAAKAATVDSERECNEMLTAEVDALRTRVAELERDFERELMCHAGCGVVAGCNTRESLSGATKNIHPDYMSASLQSCIDAAWREIYERERANKAETGLAIMAVCGYFSRMRGPDLQVAYKQFGGGCTRRFLRSEDAVRVHRDEGYEITPLYAGSAPVPAAGAADAGTALSALSKAMQDDAGLAWSWHCNIAMTAQDAGAPHDRANVWAADFMRRAFDVDTLSRVNAMIAAKAKGGGA